MKGWHLSRFVAPARDWFDAREPREQALLSLLAAVAVVGVLAIGVWRPLADARAGALADVFRYDAILARTAALKEPLLLGAPNAAKPSIADSAARHGLVVRRIEPESEERTRIVLEEADYRSVVEWISDIETAHTARAVSVDFARRPSPGVVSATVVVERGS